MMAVAVMAVMEMMSCEEVGSWECIIHSKLYVICFIKCDDIQPIFFAQVSINFYGTSGYSPYTRSEC